MAPADEPTLVAEPAAEVPAAEPPPNSQKAAWIVAGVATAIALIAAMIAVSAVMRDKNNNNANSLNAAAGFNAAGFNRPVTGTIQSIKGSSFTVKEAGFNGQTATAEVTTSNKTTFREMVSGALSDLKVGDSIVATGTTTDNVFTATQVNQNTGQRNFARAGTFANGAPPQGNFGGNGGGGPRFFQGNGNGGEIRVGQITKIDGATITVSAFDGSSVTINTTASTTYRVSKTTTLKQLKVGDTVRVFGTTSGGKTAATEVTKGAGDGPLAA